MKEYKIPPPYCDVESATKKTGQPHIIDIALSRCGEQFEEQVLKQHPELTSQSLKWFSKGYDEGRADEAMSQEP